MTKPTRDRLDEMTQALFRYAVDEGMKLTFDDLSTLRLALSKNYGLGGWQDLYRICHRIWVKPTPSLSGTKLDTAFKKLRESYKVKTASINAQVSSATSKFTAFVSGVLPTLPKQSPQDVPNQKEGDQPIAIRAGSSSKKCVSHSGRSYSLWPVQHPLSKQDYRTIWRYMKQALKQSSPELTLDLDASVERIGTEGLGADLVLKPILSRNLEFVLLLDDSFSMRPYREAIAPLWSDLRDKKIYPHAIYRLDGYPDQMLAPWADPTQPQPIEMLLTGWSAKRTVVIIFSDAGAAKGSASQQRIEKTMAFLQRLHPNVRQVLWLNPLPMSRWRGTPAQAIAKVLNGAMVPMGPVALETSRSISHQEWFVEV